MEELAHLISLVIVGLLTYVIRGLQSRLRRKRKVLQVEERALDRLADPADTDDPYEAVIRAMVDLNRDSIATVTQRIRRANGKRE